MKRGSQPRARSPSRAPRRPGFTPTCRQWRGGQAGAAHYPDLPGADDGGGGSGEGRPPERRAHQGEGARPDPGHWPRLRPRTHPRRSPKAGADLGSHGRGGGGAGNKERPAGLRRDGWRPGARSLLLHCWPIVRLRPAPRQTRGRVAHCAGRPGSGGRKGRGRTKGLHRNCTTYACLHHFIRLPVDKATSTRSPRPPQMLCLARLTSLFSNPNFLGDIPTFILSPCSPRQWMPLFELWGTEAEGGREVWTEVRTAGVEVKEWQGRGAQPGCDCS